MFMCVYMALVLGSIRLDITFLHSLVREELLLSVVL